jgi:hypothetical protein
LAFPPEALPVISEWHARGRGAGDRRRHVAHAALVLLRCSSVSCATKLPRKALSPHPSGCPTLPAGMLRRPNSHAADPHGAPHIAGVLIGGSYQLHLPAGGSEATHRWSVSWLPGPCAEYWTEGHEGTDAARSTQAPHGQDSPCALPGILLVRSSGIIESWPDSGPETISRHPHVQNLFMRASRRMIKEVGGSANQLNILTPRLVRTPRL